MKTTCYLTQSLLLASLLAAFASQAGPIIYDNGAPDYNDGIISDIAHFGGYGNQVASNFTLGADNVLADIHWWGLYFPVLAPSADNFTIYIYNDSAGSPGTVAHTIAVGAPGRTDTGFNHSNGNDFYAYEYDLTSPITLTSGVTYWLSILNDTTGDPGGEWYWAIASNGGNDQTRLLNFGSPLPWGSINVEFAYNLTGPNPPTGPSTSVPEGGSTLALLGMALAGLAWLHRRTR